MAKIEFKGIDAYSKQLAELGTRAEGVCKYAVYEGAGMVMEAIRNACPKDSGDLAESVSLSTYRNDNGFINTKIVFAGYDSKGTPNAIKAAVLESGTSKQQKHPFIRPAINSVKARVEASIEKRLDEKIKEITEKG